MPKTTAEKSAQPKKKPPLKRTALVTRQLQLPPYHWYNPATWRFREPAPAYQPLPKARQLFTTTLRQLWQHKRVFSGIVILYGLLNILLVRGLSSSNDLTTLKAALDGAVSGAGGKLLTSLSGFGYLLSTSGSNNVAGSNVYQSMLFLIVSLAFIWALRQVLAKHTVRVRDSFYQGMYPLIPFILVLLVIGVQLLPIVFGGSLYAMLVGKGILVYGWERAVAFAVFLAFALWSLRMLTASVLALYIVLLPDMTPLVALRSARHLVYRRRLLVWRKLVFLPVVLLLAAMAIESPLILFFTPVASWTFFVLSMVALPVAHGYLYNLYRSML
ncbi:MAG TPA: hypothetical protein VLF69_03595 [Candidatus Saccharimonadales bacterium]|nr:hypothetical protein [Candidatus Saccharimonadales bacterium]